MTATGSTNHSFKKLITSAPIDGTTKLSLIDRRALKLKSIQNIKHAIGKNTLSSSLSIGQIILRKLLKKELLLDPVDMQSYDLKLMYKQLSLNNHMIYFNNLHNYL